MPLLITCAEKTKPGCFCSLDFDIFLLLGVCFHSLSFHRGLSVCADPGFVPKPCTLLLMCSPAGNVLESSAVVAVAALRTWLGAGAGCCVGVLFPHRCYGACKSFSRRQSRARLLMCSQLLSLFHLENNQVKTGYKATLFPRSLFCVAQRV